MKLKTLFAIAVLAAMGSTGARAAPVAYEGTLTLGAAVTGSVGGFSYFLDDGPNVDFWRILLNAGQSYSIRGTRLNNNLDPAFDLYFGVTTADTSEFIDQTSWGGLTLIASADDEVANPGPGGDPLLTFVAPSTGLYTVAIGGFNSTDAGQYPYSLAAVPVPGTALLLLPGLIGLRLTRRRSRH